MPGQAAQFKYIETAHSEALSGLQEDVGTRRLRKHAGSDLKVNAWPLAQAGHEARQAKQEGSAGTAHTRAMMHL